MANPQLGTAAAELKIPQAVKSMPAKSYMRRGSGTEEKSSKATFEDVMKAAERFKEKTGKISETDKSKGKTVHNEKIKKHPWKTKKSAGQFKSKLVETGTGKSFVSPNGAERISLAGSEKSELTELSPKEVAAAQESDVRESRSSASLTEKKKGTAGKTDRLSLTLADLGLIPRQNSDQDGRRGKKGHIENTRSAKNIDAAEKKPTADPSAILPFPNRNDLSGRARRVEVIDRRNDDTPQELPTKTRRKSAKLSVDSDSLHNSAEKNEGFGNVIRSEIAETDIELSPRMESRAAGRSAAAELARKLDAQAGNDIVRQVKVVLNRSEAGEVRINLRPDNLGRVRVRIRMEDNRLTGRIFVDSAAARDAFKAALDGLQTKLVESGFGAADLELCWDDSSQGFEQQGRYSGGQNRNSGAAALEFENMVPTTVVDEAADGRVNMVV